MSAPIYQLSNHAEEEMIRRGIASEMVDAVMTAPDQIIESRSKRLIYQSKMEIDGKLRRTDRPTHHRHSISHE